MMQIVYFSQKEQFLTEIESDDRETIFVTPSPTKADGLRTRLKASRGDVLTIAKFTANLMEELWKTEEKPQIKRKAELLLIFGILKNKHLPALGYEQFTQAYNLFSDLRSFTLDTDALASVLDEQSPVIREAVLLFWKLLSVTGFHDEHSAYREISERLRSAEENETLAKRYVFWGFQHLNGQQVDLLKALSIRYEVLIPFPLSLKEKTKKSDWISWLRDARTTEKTLPAGPVVARGKWLPINSREIALHLKPLLRLHDQVILGVSKLSPLHLDIVPSAEVLYKIPHELLKSELLTVSSELQKFSGSHLELQDLCLKTQQGLKNLKLLRSWQLYSEALSSISELTDEAIPVDHFFLKVLDEVVRLNQPRTSYVPVSPVTMTVDLTDMSSLENVDRDRRVLLCIDERFDDVQGLGSSYTEAIQRALSVLGPLKRNELELLFRQWEFRDLFSHADVTVLMNEGTLKHSLVWKRLFSGIELSLIDKQTPSLDRQLTDHFEKLEKKTFEGAFSASKLQSFHDCPRKFYFSYVEQVFPDISLVKDFDNMTSGTVLHEIIEKFFKESHSDEELKALTTAVMNAHIRENNLHLSAEVFLQRELVFNHRAANGIRMIRELEYYAAEPITWKIEESFKLNEPFPLNGRIDCMGVSQNYIFLLDFKSSGASASSHKKVMSIDAVQLWTYAVASTTLIPEFEKKSLILGYIVLDKSEDSVIVSWDDGFVARMKEARLCSVQKPKEEFSVKFQEARDRLLALSLAARSEQSFPARPREADACKYCELTKVCVKSELLHG